MRIDYDIDVYNLIKQSKRKIEEMQEFDFDLIDDFHDDMDWLNKVKRF